MTLPTCLPLPLTPEPLQIRFPGGAAVKALRDDVSIWPSACGISLNLMQQLQPALAPIKPILDAVGAVTKMFECIQLLAESITNPLKIDDAIACLGELGVKVEALLALLPPLSVPIMVLDIIDVILAFLSCLIGQMNHLLEQAEDVAQRLETADRIGDGNLRALVLCKEDDLAALRDNASDALSGLTSLFAVLNTMLSLIGMDPLPDLSGAIGSNDYADSIRELENAITTLQAARSLIPLP